MRAGPATELPPRSAPGDERFGRRAKCPDPSVRRRAGTRPPLRKLSKLPRRPDNEKASVAGKAPPGSSPPHAASRTFSTPTENVRSDAHYVGRPGLRSRLGGGPGLPGRVQEEGKAALPVHLPMQAEQVAVLPPRSAHRSGLKRNARQTKTGQHFSPNPPEGCGKPLSPPKNKNRPAQTGPDGKPLFCFYSSILP